MKLAELCNASFVTRVYNRLFTKILDSSIWLEPLATRVVWITLLAAMDEEGFAPFACTGNVARRAGVDAVDTEAALACLESPDPNSSDPDNEGRRIEKVAGGYLVLNASKYRGLFNREIQREQTRIRVARCRAAKRNVTNCNAAVTVANDRVTQSEAEAKTKTKAVPPKERTASAPSGFAVPPCFENVDGFAAALAGWIEHRKKIRKPATGRAIQLFINTLSERPSEAVKAMDAVVRNGWQGFEWDWLLGKHDKPPERVRTYEHNTFEECQ